MTAPAVVAAVAVGSFVLGVASAFWAFVLVALARRTTTTTTPTGRRT